MLPISSRGWTFDDLLAKGKRFKPVPRVSYTSKILEEKIQQYEDGLPLVIEGWHQSPHWPQKIFSVDFCRQYFGNGDKKISARNVHDRLDRKMKFDDFIEKSRSVSTFAAAEETERWYGKDVECPEQWERWLRNEGGLPHKLVPDGGNDLLALRPKKDGRLDVETLMCYFGVADTYTPCHKDLCASSGHNLMCYTEKDGSSFWFMTSGSDSPKVTRYFHSLRHELDHESHAVTVSELAKAPFDVYIVEQKIGDLVLVPPRSCHQVINSGGLTIKMSWSRMTLPGLSVSLYHELPLYRRVCRSEIYRTKSTTYYTLCQYTQRLRTMAAQPFDTIQKSVLANDLTTVLQLYDQILVEEFSPLGEFIPSKSSESHNGDTPPGTEIQPYQLAEDFHTCDFCGADIFQSYFRCTGNSAKKSGEKGFIVCPGCYVEGRTCTCQAMEQMQCQSFDVLLAARWDALEVLKGLGSSSKSFRGSGSLQEQESYFAKRSDSSIFHAAMLLHQIMRTIQRKPTPKSCRITPEPHLVPAAWGLSCKKCHSAKCFAHLLQLCRMHSIRALLLREQDNSHETYHAVHADKFPEYEERKQLLVVAQEEGKPCTDFNTLMVYNSLKFKVCQPVNAAYAKLGWYDQLPSQKRVKSHQQPSKVDRLQKEPATRDTKRPPASLQVNVKNHAYVEVKRVKHRSAAASSDFSSSPLSSISHEDTNTPELDPRQESPVLSRGPVANPSKTEMIQPSHSVKKHEHKNKDGTIFANVFPIGPPRKRKRQEMASKSKNTVEEQPKTREPDSFAAALGAAINQVAETATSTSKSVGTRQKPENPKKQFRDNVGTSAPVIGSSTRDRRPGEDRIVVNVAELQDLVVQSAERAVRRVIGDAVPLPSLATKAAVSMMTEYAAAGAFVNGNTQIQFQSLKHFAEAPLLINRNEGASNNHQVEMVPMNLERKRDDYGPQTADRTYRESHPAHSAPRPQVSHQGAGRPEKKRPFSLLSEDNTLAGKKRRTKAETEDEDADEDEE